MAKGLNCSSTARPIRAWSDEPARRRRTTRPVPEGIGRDAGPLHRRVDIAVDDVVVGAAGAPHGEGADQEQRQMHEVREGASLRPSRRGPPTTSTARAAATRRSGDPPATASDRAGRTPAHGGRPSCRPARRRPRVVTAACSSTGGRGMAGLPGADCCCCGWAAARQTLLAHRLVLREALLDLHR